MERFSCPAAVVFGRRPPRPRFSPGPFRAPPRCLRRYDRRVRDPRWDFVVVGSGFGGSVSALRLSEKGYRVLVLERGGRFGPQDFPRSNWRLRRYLWAPRLGLRGIMKLTYMRHVTVLSGAGVGGGSLVYANTLPVPTDEFFTAASWRHLADWKRELAPHYATALRMLGATRTPFLTPPDEVLREVARDLGRPEAFESTDVAVYFGEPGVTAPDPYFGGEGPARTGCIRCGGCMVGCRHGAKNTLDQNYLYLAERRGATVQADSEVTWVRPLPEGGYALTVRVGRHALPWLNRREEVRAARVVFAGGVMGTVPLLLRLRERADGLPRLSPRLGGFVRTNSEVLVGVVRPRREPDLSQGIAIGSIVHTDAHSHLEPVRYPAGSGFFRLQAMPMATGETVLARLADALRRALRHPLMMLRTWLTRDWARSTMILLFMRTVDGTLRMRRGRSGWTLLRRGTVTERENDGPPARATDPVAAALAERVAEKLEGFPQSMLTETLLGIPTTAHVLGGCTMGASPEDGVIDAAHRVFGYEGLWVIDGSAVSANPGVNPSLTITALAERAMALVPEKSEA
jgi:cholesterol oxidase